MKERQQIEKIISVYQKNDANNHLTYLAPKVTFDDLTRDELMWISVVKNNSVYAFRTMTGKFYEITIDNVSRFKLLSD